MVDKLVISFGARRYSEVLDTALSRQDLQNSERNISLKGWLISRLNTILNLDVEPNGGSFTDTEHPLIYINIGQIRDEEELNRVWDHETAHLIYRVDPDKRESSWESILEAAAIQASIMTLASVAATTSVYLKLSRTKGVDIKTLIKEDEEKFKKRIIRAMKLQFVPSLLLSQTIHYEYFDEDEILARNVVKDFPTPRETFSRMISVIPNGSQSK